MPDEPDLDETRQPQEFAHVMLILSKGRTHDEMTGQLGELVSAVLATRKPGKIVLTLKVDPAKGVEGMVTVNDEIKLSKPEHDRPATMFFATDEGQLSLDHPNQQSMFSIQGEQTR